MSEKLESLDEKEFRKHFENAQSVWTARFEKLSKMGYVDARFEMSLSDSKRQVVEILLAPSPIQYLVNHRKVKGKVVDRVSPCLPKNIFRMIGGQDEELAKIMPDAGTVYTCGAHGLAYVFGILNSFFEKLVRRWEPRKKAEEEKKCHSIVEINKCIRESIVSIISSSGLMGLVEFSKDNPYSFYKKGVYTGCLRTKKGIQIELRGKSFRDLADKVAEIDKLAKDLCDKMPQVSSSTLKTGEWRVSFRVPVIRIKSSGKIKEDVISGIKDKIKKAEKIIAIRGAK